MLGGKLYFSHGQIVTHAEAQLSIMFMFPSLFEHDFHFCVR